MTHTEILTRMLRYAIEAEEAASASWIATGGEEARYALHRAVLARQVVEQEVRWNAAHCDEETDVTDAEIAALWSSAQCEALEEETDELLADAIKATMAQPWHA